MCMKIIAVLQRFSFLFLLGNISETLLYRLCKLNNTTVILCHLLRSIFVPGVTSVVLQNSTNTQSDSVSLATCCKNLCSQRHEATSLPELLLHERTTGLKITTSIIYIAAILFLNSLQYSVNDTNNSAVCRFNLLLLYYPPPLSSGHSKWNQTLGWYALYKHRIKSKPFPKELWEDTKAWRKQSYSRKLAELKPNVGL